MRGCTTISMKKSNKMKHIISKTLEFSKITEYIHIGTNKCCTLGFSHILLKAGIKADISLEEFRVDAPFGVDYYLWLPTKDHKAPTIKQLCIGVAAIDELTKQKIKTYVHCQNGHGRAPTLVAAYLISKGKNVEEAIDFIKKRRLIIHPNKEQVGALLDFKKAKHVK